MLKELVVELAFEKLAIDSLREMDSPLADVWFDNPDKIPTEMFISSILEKFPLVFVDDSLENSDDLAAHYKRHVDIHNFEPHNQAILINGEMIRRMCAAGQEAEASEDLNSKQHKRFRAFLYLISRAFLHEIGHVFSTFLTQGKSVTPPAVYGHVLGTSQGEKGEAGFHLETSIFGGIITICHNTEENESQAGIIVQIDTQGVHEITQETINESAKHHFKFPVPRGPQIGPNMKTVGSATGKPRTEWCFGDPMDQLETQHLLEKHGSNPFTGWEKEVDDLFATMTVNFSRFGANFAFLMMRIPFEPGFRAEDTLKSQA